MVEFFGADNEDLGALEGVAQRSGVTTVGEGGAALARISGLEEPDQFILCCKHP
jgi:hypothetical protein